MLSNSLTAFKDALVKPPDEQRVSAKSWSRANEEDQPEEADHNPEDE